MVPPIVHIDILSLRLRPIEAVETQPVEVRPNVLLNPFDDLLVVLTAQDAGAGGCFVGEPCEVLEDLVDGLVKEDGLEGPDIDCVEVFLVIVEGLFSAGAAGVEQSMTWGPEPSE